MVAKILVVDDEEDVEILVRQIFRKRIRNGEYEFVFAVNGREALDLVRDQLDIDLVLTDINMPEMDGLTFMDKLKNVRAGLDSVVISAYGDMDNIRSAMNCGAYDFLTKPIDINDLQFTITKSLEHVEQTRDNKRLQKESEEAKAESDAKSAFLASMSHDIRTPLNAIIGMTELLAETTLDKEQTEYIGIVESAGEALLDLINDILDLSKIEAGYLELESIDFNIREFIEKVAGMMAVKCESKGIKLVVNVDDDVPKALAGDPRRLRQVLINLVGNAVKFTEDGSIRIEVRIDSASEDEIGLLFLIADTGIGIAEEKKESIFEVFTQADSSTTREYGGTGLGLAICQRLVGKMRGKIWVESRLGEGSDFYFTPVFSKSSGAEADTGATVEERDSESESTDIIRPLKILLVDDSEHNRVVIQHYLKNTVHQIKCAVNGREAVSQFKSQQFDLVFMDMQMPIMDGCTATRNIREWERENERAATPIVGLTAVVFADELQVTIDAGCDETVTKPVRKATILGLISKYRGAAAEAESVEAKPAETPSAPDGRTEAVVHIDSEIKDIVPGYLEDMKREVGDYHSALAEGDYTLIERLGHRMRGSGGAYGFDDLSDYGRKIEEAARGKQGDAIEKLVDELAAFYAKLEVVYD